MPDSWELGRADSQPDRPPDTDLVMLVPPENDAPPTMWPLGDLREERRQFAPVTLYDGSVTLPANQIWRAVDLTDDWDEYDAIHIRYPLREDPLLARTFLRSDFERLTTQIADGSATWYGDANLTALFLVDQGGQGLAIGVSTDRGELLFAHSVNAAPAAAVMQVLGLRYGGLRGEPGTPGADNTNLEPADLKAAYFPEHESMLALPEAAGAYEIEILDPVNLSATLVDGDQFIVHGVAATPPTGMTMHLQIRGRYDDTVTTDEVEIHARQPFAKLTLNTPGPAEDTIWKLYLRGTKPATAAGTTLGYTLREIIGVKGGTQPFAGSVAQMIEDLLHYRLLLNYGIFRHETNHLYRQGQVILDPFDNNLYRFLPSFEHSTAVPSENPTQWARMTFPGPLTWAREGNTDLIPSSKLPAPADAVTDAEIDARILEWARTGSTAPVPNGKLSLGLSTRFLVNPEDPADGRDRSVEIVVAGESTRLYGATTERAGLMTATEHVNLAALLSGRRFIGLWVVDTAYGARDIVYDYNPETGITVQAEARTTHVATLTNRPAAHDTGSNDWHVIEVIRQSPHARSTTALDARITEVAPEQPTIPGPSDWWRGFWSSAHSYSTGEIVGHENAWFQARADIAVGGGDPEDDTARWTEIMRLDLQLTTEGVLRYRLDFGAPAGGQDQSWDDVSSGLMIWRGAWAVPATYNIDNLVTHDGYIWIAQAAHASTSTNGPGTSETRWLRFGPYVPEASPASPMVWYGAWVRNVAFPEGRVVTRGGHTYIAHNDVVAGVEPGVSAHWTSSWTEIL